MSEIMMSKAAWHEVDGDPAAATPHAPQSHTQRG